MEQVTKADDVYTLIQKVKSGQKSFITNLFIDPEQLNNWISDHLLYFEESSNGVLFFRKSNSFFHLYYCTPSLNHLSGLLSDKPTEEKLVVDILGPESAVKQVESVFANAGFAIHTHLHRYTRINNDNSDYYQKANEIELALEDSLSAIAEMLEKEFDKYAEQIPTVEEIRKMIQKKMIVIIKEQNAIKGFLIRKTIGQTTILNNFLVDKKYRGEKIGSKLLKYYIFESKSIKRMLLWVIWNNDTAINMYKYHNYVKDNMIDTIMLKG